MTDLKSVGISGRAGSTPATPTSRRLSMPSRLGRCPVSSRFQQVPGVSFLPPGGSVVFGCFGTCLNSNKSPYYSLKQPDVSLLLEQAFRLAAPRPPGQEHVLRWQLAYSLASTRSSLKQCRHAEQSIGRVPYSAILSQESAWRLPTPCTIVVPPV